MQLFQGSRNLLRTGNRTGAGAGHVRNQCRPIDFFGRLSRANGPHGNSLFAKSESEPISTNFHFARDGPGEFLHGRDSYKVGEGCRKGYVNSVAGIL
jgi:hypothetical protein